jgi:hypothetical protein
MCALNLALAGTAHGESFPPRNECESMEYADHFRLSLATAVANRDADMLGALVDPDIRLDFGGGFGWETMKERLENPTYRLWNALDEVQRLGCGIEGDQLYLPWYWGQNLGSGDPFASYIATGYSVPMMSEPKESSETSRVIKQLDWELVEVINEWEDYGEFAQIQTADGQGGFVKKSQLRSEIDYRLIAMRRDGEWKIVVFIAGD